MTHHISNQGTEHLVSQGCSGMRSCGSELSHCLRKSRRNDALLRTEVTLASCTEKSGRNDALLRAEVTLAILFMY
jgi:hypothetical protein